MTNGVDVVITAYGRRDLTASCLSHLAQQSRPHRVIVVDNGSDDDTSAMIEREWPDVHLVRFETNMPYPIATNRGVSEGTNPFVVMLNNDVDCRPDFLENLIRALETHEDAGSAAALLVRPDETEIDSFGLATDRTLSCFPRLRGAPVRNRAEPNTKLLGPAGAAAAFRRAAWEAVDGLDEELPAYMEDFDLALRLRAAGFDALAVQGAVGTHWGSATFGHQSKRQRWLGGFGRAYVVRRYGLLNGIIGLQITATECGVALVDLLMHRDLEAVKGRAAGWHAAGSLARRSAPPRHAIDPSISFIDTLRYRMNAATDSSPS